MVLLLPMLGSPSVLAASNARDDRFSAGIQVSVAKDLPDRIEFEEAAEFDIGPAVVIPFRLSLFQGLVDLRAALETHAAPGTDRVIWTDGDSTFYKDDQPAQLWAAHLLVGPEVRVPTGAGSPVVPYLGAALGPGRVRTTHTFEDEVADLLTDPGAVTRSRQWVLTAGGHAGLRVHLGAVAPELEVGYTVSSVEQAPLSNTDESYDVRREAYGLGVFRLGLGLIYPF